MDDKLDEVRKLLPRHADEREARDAGILVLPHSGAVLDRSDVRQCVAALQELRTLEQAIRQVKHELTAAISAEARTQGQKTLLVDGRKVEVRGGQRVHWDAQMLEDELRAAGMPEERIREIVKEEVSYTVNAREAKKAAGANEEYAEIVERAQHVQPDNETIVVSER